MGNENEVAGVEWQHSHASSGATHADKFLLCS
jgi:hypothetical protein